MAQKERVIRHDVTPSRDPKLYEDVNKPLPLNDADPFIDQRKAADAESDEKSAKKAKK